MSREWKRSTSRPSVLVPFRKQQHRNRQLQPLRDLLGHRHGARQARPVHERSFRLLRAALPKNGQPSISALATKKHGMAALMMMMSR